MGAGRFFEMETEQLHKPSRPDGRQDLGVERHAGFASGRAGTHDFAQAEESRANPEAEEAARDFAGLDCDDQSRERNSDKPVGADPEPRVLSQEARPTEMVQTHPSDPLPSEEEPVGHRQVLGSNTPAVLLWLELGQEQRQAALLANREVRETVVLS